MVKSMRLTYSEFEALVHDFNDLVADKLYSKMDYHMWRKISCYREPESVVFIEWDNEAADLTFGEELEWHHFVFGDDSFGDFLLDNVLKDGNEYWIDPWYEDDISEIHKQKEKNVQEIEFMTSDGKIHKAEAHVQCTSSDVYPKKNFKIDFAQSEAISNAISTRDKMLDLLSTGSIGLAAIPADAGPSVSCVIDTKVDKAEFDARLDELASKVQGVINKYENNNDKKEKVMKGFNFDFGPMNGNVVRMSIYGLAVKNKTGSWVAYDAKNEEIMDVDVFNFDGAKFLYRMPVAINDVTAGDVIVHMSVPMFVVGKSEDGKAVYAVDPVAGERKEIMLTKSPFGFNFVTKVVNFLGNAFNADASNPFGNLGLMMMLSEDNKGMSDMLPFMLMANGGNAAGFDMSNPMVLYMMCKDGAGDLPMMLALSGAFNKPAVPHVCNCGQNHQ